jgi:hypothetical protein
METTKIVQEADQELSQEIKDEFKREYKRRKFEIERKKELIEKDEDALSEFVCTFFNTPHMSSFNASKGGY